LPCFPLPVRCSSIRLKNRDTQARKPLSHLGETFQKKPYFHYKICSSPINETSFPGRLACRCHASDRTMAFRCHLSCTLPHCLQTITRQFLPYILILITSLKKTSCTQEGVGSIIFGRHVSNRKFIIYSESWRRELSIGIYMGPIGGGWVGGGGPGGINLLLFQIGIHLHTHQDLKLNFCRVMGQKLR